MTTDITGQLFELGTYVTVKTGSFENTVFCRGDSKFRFRNDMNAAFYDELNLIQCGYNFLDWMHLSVNNSSITDDLHVTFDVKRAWDEQVAQWTGFNLIDSPETGIFDAAGQRASNYFIDNAAGTIELCFSPGVEEV